MVRGRGVAGAVEGVMTRKGTTTGPATMFRGLWLERGYNWITYKVKGL